MAKSAVSLCFYSAKWALSKATSGMSCVLCTQYLTAYLQCCSVCDLFLNTLHFGIVFNFPPWNSPVFIELEVCQWPLHLFWGGGDMARLTCPFIFRAPPGPQCVTLIRHQGAESHGCAPPRPKMTHSRWTAESRVDPVFQVCTLWLPRMPPEHPAAEQNA